MCPVQCCELGASHTFSEVRLNSLCSLCLPAWTLQGSGRFQLELLMLPAAEEGEVCRQPEGKAVVRPAAAGRGTAKATTVGFMEVWHYCETGARDPLQTPWKVLVSLYPLTKWHGLAFYEGKSLTNTPDTSKKTLLTWGLQSWGTLSNAFYFCWKASTQSCDNCNLYVHFHPRTVGKL